MKYMLDTNICIYIIRQKPVQVIQRLQQEKLGDICISSITLAELEYGIEKSARRIQNKLALAEFLAPIKILNFDDTAASVSGNIRAELEKSGKIIGPYDLLIAAHALSLDLTLVTNNIKEFLRVKNLKIENWV